MAVLSFWIHAAVLAAALLMFPVKAPEDSQTPPSTVAVVFDAGKRSGPSQPEPEAKERAPSPQPNPSVPASPAPPTTLRPPTAQFPPQQEPQPEPSTPAPHPKIPEPTAPETPTPAAQSPPKPGHVEKPAEIAPPAVRLPPPVFQPVHPEPPAVPVPPPQRPPPTPRPRFASPAPPSRAPTEFPAPTMRNWSLGSPKQGPSSLSPSARVDSAALGADWMNALSAWIEQHKYYPEQAVRNREDGDVTVTVIVSSDGRVQSVQLERRSGSMWLDLAWQAMFRDARLPPFPPGTAEHEATVHLTMHYVLLH